MCRITSFLLCALAAVVVFPPIAAAEHGEQNIEFDTLRGQLHTGQLTLVYKVDRRDWKRLRRKGVQPTLNLWLAPSGEGDAAFSYSQKLSDRKGSFTYPKSVAVRNGDRIEIELIGFHKDWRVESVSLDDQVGPWISFTVADGRLVVGADSSASDDEPDEPVEPEEPAEPEESEESEEPQVEPDPKWRIHVIKACKDALYSSRIDECVEKATKISPYWAAGAVNACDKAFSSSSYITKCIDGARSHTFEPAETIEACDDEFASSSSTFDCMEKTANYTSPPAAVVRACGQATYTSSKAKSCLDAARGLGDSAAGLVKACEGSKVASCLKSASGGSDP